MLATHLCHKERTSLGVKQGRGIKNWEMERDRTEKILWVSESSYDWVHLSHWTFQIHEIMNLYLFKIAEFNSVTLPFRVQLAIAELLLCFWLIPSTISGNYLQRVTLSKKRSFHWQLREDWRCSHSFHLPILEERPRHTSLKRINGEHQSCPEICASLSN